MFLVCLAGPSLKSPCLPLLSGPTTHYTCPIIYWFLAIFLLYLFWCRPDRAILSLPRAKTHGPTPASYMCPSNDAATFCPAVPASDTNALYITFSFVYCSPGGIMLSRFSLNAAAPGIRRATYQSLHKHSELKM